MAQPGDKIPALCKHNAVAQNQMRIWLGSRIKPVLIDRLTLYLFLLFDHHIRLRRNSAIEIRANLKN